MSNFFQIFRTSLLVSPVLLATTSAAIATEVPSAKDLSLQPDAATELSSLQPTLEETQALELSQPLDEVKLGDAIAQTPPVESPNFALPLIEANSTVAPVSDLTTTLQQINQYSRDINMGQVTSISQLRDVQPTDWAFQALQSLVERYGCIAGYPDGTYRGNRAMTRYEFAAGLNACLDRINELIAAATSNLLTREDLLALQRLQEEFAAELATLRGRVDALEARTAELEANQFSTTTKLVGEVLWSLESAFGDEKPDSDEDVEDNFTFSGRVRLNFDTSFTGRDRLRTRLQAANMPNLAEATGTRMANRNLGSTGDNTVTLNKLWYLFPIGDNITFHVATTGLLIDDVLDAVSTSPYAIDALNLFVAYNNLIYNVSPAGGAGVGANIRFNNSLGLDLGYFTADAADPSESEGLFNGQYAAAAQLNVGLGDAFDLALSYVRSFQNGDDGYDLSGFVGSSRAAQPFGDEDNAANHYGVQANWRLGRRFSVSGYIGYVDAESKDSDSDASIWNWAVNVAFPDLGKEGSVFLVGFGMPPKLTDSDGNAVDEDSDTSYVLDVEYRFPITDNINLAPGFYAIFNPEHDSDNDTIYVGMLRTIFNF